MSFDWLALFLLAQLTVLMVLSNVLAPKRFARLMERIAADRSLLAGYYLRGMATTWAMALFVPLIVVISSHLSASDVGWAWPNAVLGLDYVLAALAMGSLTVSSVRARKMLLGGSPIPARSKIAAMLPQSPRERWLAAAFGASAGITEELVYRGLLIGAGIHLLHLPSPVAALLSLALFTWAHAYQGRQGLIGSAVVGGILTALYVISGSVILPILIHSGHNLISLLLVPAHPTPRKKPSPKPTPPPDPPLPVPLQPGAPPVLRPAIDPGP